MFGPWIIYEYQINYAANKNLGTVSITSSLLYSFKSFFMNLYYFILYSTSSFQSTYAYRYLQALKWILDRGCINIKFSMKPWQCSWKYSRNFTCTMIYWEWHENNYENAFWFNVSLDWQLDLLNVKNDRADWQITWPLSNSAC